MNQIATNVILHGSSRTRRTRGYVMDKETLEHILSTYKIFEESERWSLKTRFESENSGRITPEKFEKFLEQRGYKKEAP